MSSSAPELAVAADHAREGRTTPLLAAVAAGLSVDSRDVKGNTLLMLAAYHGRTDTVTALLRAGAQPDLRNEKGQTPLGGVAFKGHLAIAQALLQAGADPLADQGGATPVDYAVTFGRTDILTLLQAQAGHAAQPTRWYSRLIGWFRRADRSR